MISFTYCLREEKSHYGLETWYYLKPARSYLEIEDCHQVFHQPCPAVAVPLVPSRHHAFATGSTPSLSCTAVTQWHVSWQHIAPNIHQLSKWKPIELRACSGKVHNSCNIMKWKAGVHNPYTHSRIDMTISTKQGEVQTFYRRRHSLCIYFVSSISLFHWCYLYKSICVCYVLIVQNMFLLKILHAAAAKKASVTMLQLLWCRIVHNTACCLRPWSKYTKKYNTS